VRIKARKWVHLRTLETGVFCFENRKVRNGGKVRNFGETFAHLDFGVFSAWEMGKVRKCWEMCVYTV